MQQSFFSNENEANQPLAARLRPQTLEEFVGQRHLLGPGKVLRRLIESDNISSMIFWGPPGVGKTTLARIIARRTKAEFIDFSAVTSGIREIREVMQQAEANRRFGGRTIVFVDEIHRFNKAQQDAFLPFVEKGSILLIGATTENPSFEINGALLSRCKVFVLQALGEDDLAALVKRALSDPRGFGGQKIEMPEDLPEVIARFANGDARSALSTLEMVVLNAELDGEVLRVTDETLAQCTSRKSLLYDKKGALQPDLRAAQVHAQFRPGRGGLLAGANAGIGRGPDVHCPPRDALRERGRRAGRPARAADRRRRERGLPSDRHAGMLGAPDRGGRVHVARAEVERAVRRL